MRAIIPRPDSTECSAVRVHGGIAICRATGTKRTWNPDDVLGLVNAEGAACHNLLSSKSEAATCCHSSYIVLNSFPAVGSSSLEVGVSGIQGLTFFRVKLYLLSWDDQAYHLSFLSQTPHFRNHAPQRSSILRSVLYPFPRGSCPLCADLAYSLTEFPIGTPYFDNGFDSTWAIGF